MTHFLLLLLTPAVFIDIGKTVISSALAFALIHSPLNSPNESKEALSSRELSNGQQYDTFSATYDNLNGGSFSNMLGIDEMRLLAGKYVYGDTLEIAVGTGLQSQYYTWSQLKSYTGIDMSQGMLSEAGNRIPQMAAKSNIKVPIDIKQMDTTKLNFADNEVPLANSSK